VGQITQLAMQRIHLPQKPGSTKKRASPMAERRLKMNLCAACAPFVRQLNAKDGQPAGLPRTKKPHQYPYDSRVLRGF
jgi:hypothetical protein